MRMLVIGIGLCGVGVLTALWLLRVTRPTRVDAVSGGWVDEQAYTSGQRGWHP